VLIDDSATEDIRAVGSFVSAAWLDATAKMQEQLIIKTIFMVGKVANALKFRCRWLAIF
jgi:hypothetical protein